MGKTRYFLALAAFLLLLLLGVLVLRMKEVDILHDVRTASGAECGNLYVYVLNVSQADAIVIITPAGRTMLVDAGSKMKGNSSANMLAFLKRHNISRIDYVIATHYHEDHIGGMQELFLNSAVGAVYENGNCAGYESGVAKAFSGYRAIKNFTQVHSDMELQIDNCLSGARLLVAYDRAKGCWQKSQENDNSILLRLTYGNTSFLFAGDCEKDCEGQLLAQNTALGADFLKVGHHGSDTSTTDAFLDAVNAKYFALSVDEKKSASEGYFHPKESTLRRMWQRSPAGVYRTDINGDIKAVSDGGRIAITTDTG